MPTAITSNRLRPARGTREWTHSHTILRIAGNAMNAYHSHIRLMAVALRGADGALRGTNASKNVPVLDNASGRASRHVWLRSRRRQPDRRRRAAGGRALFRRCSFRRGCFGSRD